MKDLIIYILQNIVNHPNDINIEEKVENYNGRDRKVFEISVNPEDIPFVIGKKGKTIQAIRNIVKIRAVKDGSYVDVSVKEN
jgi:predicted RNA-binding protein YlqC (UPF0109 family)